MRKFSITVIVGTFLLAACSMSGSLKSKRAVQGAIEAHLRGNSHLSMQNFNTEIENVTFKDDTADALAKFVSKEPPHNAVEVRYQLKLDGLHWKVVSSAPTGGQGMGTHMGGAGSMAAPSTPQGHPEAPMEPSH
ncbi:MAG TPA: hypothetical protein VNG91_08565 [Terriglobia bacterium]|nr:hypothetical protein [Terriglobia bacterium]